ncbi:protein MAINTENANCE OF MERISTEMS-like [Spinacia oleracea]|uniref:Protein MAINTENANCE OF MERISTEMS-like n=1 Tax=Spinacia oleracea TaxID=3562 RepID=A0ABM3R883_SPIOL|nr:protein MAINTENANCE OF MERISTEMS-like [Spinacia oleracea]
MWVFRDIVGPNASRRFLRLILVCWCDTTITFHFPWGEMTITPEDYTALTNLSFTGRPVYISKDTVMPGGKYKGKGTPYSLLVDFLAEGRLSGASVRMYARVLYLLFLSSTILSKCSERVDPWQITLVSDLSELGSYCWGEATYGNLISHMGVVVLVLDGPDRPIRPISLCVVPRLIELWAFERLPFFVPRSGRVVEGYLVAF